MRALSLDYQRKPPRVSRAGAMVLLLGILAVILVGEAFVQLNRQKDDLEASAARAERKRVPVARGLSEQDTKRFAEEIKVADSVAERLTLPWADLFDALESSSSSNVALLALEPDVPKRIIRITAEARNKNDMLAYVNGLNEEQRLVNVHLMDHQLQAQTPGEPVRFSIQASWARMSKREQN